MSSVDEQSNFNMNGLTNETNPKKQVASLISI